MKSGLPKDHGLSAASLKKLMFYEGETPVVTDAQHAALVEGVARGESVLVLSPTSTGKTQIACWAIAFGIEHACNTVYLVTHRALAKQKFEELQRLLLDSHLAGDRSSIVLANGDTVEDAAGDIPGDPLKAPVLVATYEKYLALLSGSGVPTDMSGTVVVCDEIQLLGDETRGQNVEILLTLLKNAGWRQLVGLSAVLQPKDASELASWLGVTLVTEQRREKNLRYECWTTDGIHAVSTDKPDDVKKLGRPKEVELTTLSVVRHVLTKIKSSRPAIVFCMSKRDTYQLAAEYRKLLAVKTPQLSLDFQNMPETGANSLLAEYLPLKFAIHNADLMDEEREVVERVLLTEKLDLVFATSTLAAGVNFPIGTAVFASWARWVQGRRGYVPIEPSEFHNMAGRAGRMGFAHGEGRVVFLATDAQQIQAAKAYMNIAQLPSIVPRIRRDRFDQLALQLVASGICHTRMEIENLVKGTFSGLREQDRNAKAFANWPGLLNEAVNLLARESLVVETSQGRLSATPLGKATAYSGLLPITPSFFLQNIVSRAMRLSSLLPGIRKKGDATALCLGVFATCFASPEFRPLGATSPARFLPWPLDRQALFNAEPYRDLLPDPTWHADLYPINAAYLANEWIGGAPIRDLERSLPQLSAGMLRDMFRNLVWCLQGLANVLTAVVEGNKPGLPEHPALQGKNIPWNELRRLISVLRRLSWRVNEGLPDDVLWMTRLNTEGAPFRLRRSEILEFRKKGFIAPEQMTLGDKKSDDVRAAVFSDAKPTPLAKSNWARDAARQWKQRSRLEAAKKHAKRAQKCPEEKLVDAFYGAAGDAFEKTFEQVLSYLKIKWEKLDQRSKTGAPDYLISFSQKPPIVFELKSKQGDKLVDYGDATEVLGASEIHGHKDKFCVTLCHPGVDPSVPSVVVDCGRLSVVESPDLGEALLRLCEKKITEAQVWQWLSTPGQALAADLPFKDQGF